MANKPRLEYPSPSIVTVSILECKEDSSSIMKLGIRLGIVYDIFDFFIILMNTFGPLLLWVGFPNMLFLSRCSHDVRN